jgi:Tol biopolymer transport system component
MALNEGTRLGRYEIRSLIGAGGMGEVYRAADPKIGREVAIKVLPAALSGDADRLARFEQEAQAAGSLNHPNILAIYDVQTENGAPYVVSELLEGETLREKMATGPVAQRKALDYALQIAHGLGAAHERGIVHRDMKPENVFVTSDGRVKILDFGLAKLMEPDGEAVGTDLPTRKLKTDPGTIMGTIAYMSPEQVRARPLDHRTDIFSFGVIFYEMLSGKRAFDGDSTADLMSAILREEPPRLSMSNANVSPALERVIEHCLEKSPDERFRSAKDLAFAIEALSTATSVSSETAVDADLKDGGKARSRSSAWGWVAATVFLLAAGVLGYMLWSSKSAVQPPIRFAVEAPGNAIDMDHPAISPDGRTIAFVATLEGQQHLFLRSLGNTTPQRLTGTEDADRPFWSPDGRYVGFFAENKLKRVEAAGGPVQNICEARSANGGTWAADGTIIFGMYDKGIHKVSAAGGTPVEIVPVDRENKEIDHASPYLLPDGKNIVYLSWKGAPDQAEIRAANISTGENRLVLVGNSNAAYAYGHLIYSRESTLMAQRFDPGTLSVSGDAFPVQENVMFSPNSSISSFSVSSNGILVFKLGGGSLRQLAWIDRSGKRLGNLDPPAIYNDAVLSPDGRWVAVQRMDGDKGSIWTFDTSRNLTSRFTLAGNDEDDPVWSRDSKYLYFTSGEGGDDRIARKSVIGGSEEILADAGGSVAGEGIDIAPDGSVALVPKLSPKGGTDIWIVPLDGPAPASPFMDAEYTEGYAKFSPDGRWIAYVSTESARPEVYVRSYPGDAVKRQVSVQGGGQPRWSRDGKELFYLDTNRQLISVRVRSAAEMEFDAPVVLFRTTIGGLLLPNRFDVSADGQRFLVNSSMVETERSPFNVVVNWRPDQSR